MIRGMASAPTIVDLSPNVAVISALTDPSPGISHYTVNVTDRKVDIKFMTNPSNPRKGPRIVIGMNGPIQYMGSSNLVGRCYKSLYELMSTNIRKKRFMRCIAQCNVIDTPIYPSGVSRSEPSHVLHEVST